MCVALLGFQPMHHFTEDEPSEKSKDQPGKSQENSFVTSEDSLQEEPSPPAVQEEPSPPAEAPDKAPDASQSSDHSRQRTSEQISTSCCDQCFSGLYQKHSRMSWCSGGCVTDHSQSPWVLRCKLSAGALNPKMAGHLNAPCLKQRVLRQPFRPDCTKGFQGRGKLLQRTVADVWVNNILQKFRSWWIQ